MISETAFAKVNLALHVRRRRADGYHDLETLFAFVDDGDALTFTAGESVSLAIDGPFAYQLADEDARTNLVLRAAEAMRSHFAVAGGAHLTLTKNLPVASGIGGGSADAAAAARGLNRLWGLGASEADLVRAVGGLGADIPACVASYSSRGEATGEALSPLGGVFSGIPVLLANPMSGVSTARVFFAWDGFDLGALADGDAMKAALAGRNDLTKPATILCPDIAVGLSQLQKGTPRLCRMSGSGATLFALYANDKERDAARAEFQKALPDWWTMAGRLR